MTKLRNDLEEIFFANFLHLKVVTTLLLGINFTFLT